MVTPSAVALGVVAGLFVGQAAGAGLGAPAAAGVTAAWSGTTVKAAQVTEAKASSIFVKVGTNGAVTNAGTRFQVGALVVDSIGYAELVNDSSMPGTLSVTASLLTVVGTGMVNVCSEPWRNGVCPGTNTLVGGGALLAGGTVTYTTPTQIDVGKAVYFKVVFTGVAGGAALVANTPAFRGPQERTFS
ncbi:hypothetical protein GCU60_10100 [Blastococcus saxobsidens]|uniref:Uncharacterized protein n=1 Tax=Blastococcus saxobsidens TaxID=138336 RepID=A0A6L9W1Y9_9ACTN|nr:hypothetical protein [Blastococcus saxobsidens]NEK86107.1 hypothetical protein [Blastococcus saxobsidens]